MVMLSMIRSRMTWFKCWFRMLVLTSFAPKTYHLVFASKLHPHHMMFMSPAFFVVSRQFYLTTYLHKIDMCKCKWSLRLDCR